MKEILPETTKKTALKFKWFLIPVIITLLILLGEGVYYFLVVKDKGLIKTEEVRTFGESEYIAEDSEIYKVVQGEKYLVGIQGWIDEITESELKIKTNEEEVYSVSAQEISQIYAAEVQGEEVGFGKAIEYSDLKLGIYLTYNPSSGAIFAFFEVPVEGKAE